MIEKQLNVGDHITDANGRIYVIDAVNKTSYRAKRADEGYGLETVPFNGLQRWYSDVREFFVCDDVQLKIIADLGKENRELQQKLKEMERDITIAKNLKENLEWLCYSKLSDLEQRQDDLEQRQDKLED